MQTYMNEEKREERADSDTLLTIEEVAFRLRITRRKAAELVRSGKLANLKIGKKRLVRPIDLQAFIDANVGPKERE